MNISIYMFFVVLCTFVGWDSLFEFITESILNSSKEVGSAAITTLHIVLTTHAVKVNQIFSLLFSMIMATTSLIIACILLLKFTCYPFLKTRM